MDANGYPLHQMNGLVTLDLDLPKSRSVSERSERTIGEADAITTNWRIPMTKTMEELHQEAISKMAVPTTEILLEVLKEMEEANKDFNAEPTPSGHHLGTLHSIRLQDPDQDPIANKEISNGPLHKENTNAGKMLRHHIHDARSTPT